MRKKTQVVLLILTVVFCLSGCYMPGPDLDKETAEIPERYDRVYEISEMLSDEQYESYMEDDGTLFRKLLDFRSGMSDLTDFEFFAYYNGVLEIIGHDVPAACMVNYGTEFEAESMYETGDDKITASNVIQVSENFFSLFPMSIAEGRTLENAEYQRKKADVIPVLLGRSFRDTFTVGDTFDAYYILERKTFEVIGFVDSDSSFFLRSQNRMEPYDNYVIMPMSITEEDSFAARALLLQSVCGFIEPTKSRKNAIAALRNELRETGLEEWAETFVFNEKSLMEKLLSRK